MKKNIFLAFIFFGLTAFAEVNPISGELTFDVIDILTKEAITPFKIQRMYNHKRKTYGIFGNNWCSQIEETVVRSNAGFEIRNCGQTTASVFIKVDGGYTNSDGSEIMQELPNNAGYMRVTDQFVYGYNDQGQLAVISLKSKVKEPIVRVYFNKFNMIDRIIHLGKKHYVFTFVKGEKVVEKIEGPQKIKATYKYDKNYNLITVENAWGKKLAYSYDAVGRINKFTLPEDKTQSVVYDDKLDAVKKIVDAKDCGLELNYNMNVKTAALITTVNDNCAKKNFEFASESSPLFQKHRFDVKSLFRAPTAIKSDLLADAKTWKTILKDDIRWEYQENEFGYVSQVKRTNIHTKKQKVLSTKYENERLVELELKGEGKITFKYSGGTLSAIDAKNYAAFNLYTEFLLAKNGAINE